MGFSRSAPYYVDMRSAWSFVAEAVRKLMSSASDFALDIISADCERFTGHRNGGWEGAAILVPAPARSAAHRAASYHR